MIMLHISWRWEVVHKRVDKPNVLYIDGKKTHSNPHNGIHGEVYKLKFERKICLVGDNLPK